MSKRLQVALHAAHAAGKILAAKFNRARAITSKGKRDIVTDADFAADRAIRKIFAAQFPRDLFLSEEDSPAARAALWQRAEETGEPLWVVDPLDGTANYARRVPAFCVSIALYRAGRVEIGVVYDPLLDEMFAAERGAGARRNGRRIAVSRTKNFADAIIGMEYARKPQLRAQTVRVLRRVVGRALTARALGAAALSLCYVAAGRFDGYYHYSLSPWDVAAGACIIEEAGGKVTTPAGRAWSVHSGAYVASNHALHAALLRCNKT